MRLISAGMVAIATASVLHTSAIANDADHPTVVELYQSQGCSSCPPAIANINAIAGRPDILALTFAVTYWDQLGWKDTFARPEFTQRQRDFARAAGRDNVGTPQTIINGRAITNGGDRAQLIAAIRSADRGVSGPAITAGGGKIRIARGMASRPATIWLVHYDARPLSVPIRAGENGGKTITHRNVVRSLSVIGHWYGHETSVPAPPATNSNLHSAVLVQSGVGGPIIAAAKL